jgi:acetyl-CoA carboxylase carboxyltransferase component
VSRLDDLRSEAHLGGGENRIKKRHESGKLTARERLNLLLDPDTFHEMGMLVTHNCYDFGMDGKKIPGDGVVTGYGLIHGRKVCAYAEDFTIFGGSLSKAVADKISKLQDISLKNGLPIVAIKDSGGARIQEGISSLAGYGDIFFRNVKASGVVPQISAIMGPCAGGAVYSPALTDFVFMVDQSSYMFLTGPDVIKEVTHEDVTFEELGGAAAHARKSGVSHFIVNSEEKCIALIRELMTYLPQNNMSDPPRLKCTDPVERSDEFLDSVVPEDSARPYDMQSIIKSIVDDGKLLQVHEDYAPNMIVGFSRMDGMPVGIVANQPAVLAGVLDTISSVKAARFVRFCDCFNIPVIVFEDAPGFLPGVEQEHSGVIRDGAKLLYAFCEATVPRITVVTRKAFGGAYIAMNSKNVGADMNFAWPSAQIAVMGAKGAVKILYKREIAKDEDPDSKRQLLIDEYNEMFNNPWVPAGMGYIDEVIKPHETRSKIISSLRILEGKRETMPPRKHGNGPL